MLKGWSVCKKGVFFIPVALFFGAILSGGIDTATKNALKVQYLIKKIKVAETEKDKKERRSESVLEREINAYISYLIKQEPDPIVRRLVVTLLDGNFIRGILSIDLTGLGLAFFLPTEMNMEFEGVLEARNQNVRFIVRKLFLEKQPIQPDILNVIISAVAELNQTEPVTIDQWQPLPYGIRMIETSKGAATVYY